MPAPSWGNGNEPAQSNDPNVGSWNDGSAAADTGVQNSGPSGAGEHGFDIGVKPELYPAFEPERQKIKEHGWVEGTPYNYEALGQNAATAGRDWANNARVYEWTGEEGDVGPESQDLELELFGDPDKRSGSGIDFST